MSRPLAFTLLVFTFFGFQNCSGFHSPGASDFAASSAATANLVVDPTLQSQALTILSNKCASCHENITSGGVTHILDVGHLIATGLIVVGDPTQGRVIGAIQAGTMPVGGSVSAPELQILKDWITSMHYVGTGPLPAPAPQPLPAGKVVIADATLHGQAMRILNANCAGCHQGITSGGVTDILNINHLQATQMIVAGDPTKGSLLASIQAGTMPKGNGANVTAADLTTLKNWISSMSIVDEALAPVPLPTRAELTATFTGVNANIIQPKCTACHGPVLARGFNLNTYNAVKSRTSNILSECQSGSMPEAPYPRLTTQELSALQTWIANGALNN